jgi:hypothetical protein
MDTSAELSGGSARLNTALLSVMAIYETEQVSR